MKMKKIRSLLLALSFSPDVFCAEDFTEIGIRQRAQDLYIAAFVEVEPPIEWTGDYASCDPGSTSQAFRTSIFHRIDYYRQQAGLLPVTESLTYAEKAQAAAFMISVNKQSSHYPTADWRCYTDAGAEAASKSNLFLGVAGLKAIEGYMDDPGSKNYRVGHRNWILRRDITQMGSGDVPGDSEYPNANALWVVTSEYTPRGMRDEYVAWPPANGFTPYQVVYSRWSFKMEGADLSEAHVSMHNEQGDTIPVQLEYQPADSWYPLVWIPDIPSSTFFTPREPPIADEWYRVAISNVNIEPNTQTVEYSVVVFDPATVTEENRAPLLKIASDQAEVMRIMWKSPCPELWEIESSTDLIGWVTCAVDVSFDGFQCSADVHSEAAQQFFRLRSRDD